MTTIEKLRTLARDLAGDAWDYDRRQVVAQGHVVRIVDGGSFRRICSDTWDNLPTGRGWSFSQDLPAASTLAARRARACAACASTPCTGVVSQLM